MTPTMGRRVSGDFPATVEGCGQKGGPTAKVKLRKSRSDHPRMKAKVKAGAEAQISEFKLKLPKQLRFANGSDFRRGAKATKGSKLGGGRRKVKVSSKEGAEKLKVRVKGSALDRIKNIKKGKRLGFPIKVKDVDGNKTKIKARAKAR